MTRATTEEVWGTREAVRAIATKAGPTAADIRSLADALGCVIDHLATGGAPPEATDASVDKSFRASQELLAKIWPASGVAALAYESEIERLQKEIDSVRFQLKDANRSMKEISDARDEAYAALGELRANIQKALS